MPKNLINAVDAIAKEQRRGWPYGQGDVHKLVPVLMARITELEAALSPFATVAAKNMHVQPENGLQSVYFTDLINALETLDENNSKPLKREDFFDFPAE
jgi:hypothetical protein